jgi:hypothetical protein
MANDVAVKKALDDGFSGYSDEVEGSGNQSSDRGIPIVKFSNEGKWLFGEEELPPEREYMVGKIGREMIKWVDGVPGEESYALEPGQPFPDVAALNEAVPQDEWREDPSGKMVGPWVAQHVAFLLDVADMSKYRFPTCTVGGAICISAIVQRTNDKRRFEPGAYPVVKLRNTFMKTKFGGRLRPHFEVVRWIAFDDGTPVTLPPPSTKPQLNNFAEKPAPVVEKTVTAAGERKYELSTGTAPAESKSPKKTRGARTVAEPTLKQEMGGDEVPF